MPKLLVITDFDSSGSGYKNICAPLFTKMSEKGYEIYIIGLMYRGDEHPFPFSVVPCQNLQDATAIANIIAQVWGPDAFIVALDIPAQSPVYNELAKFGKKYIAITPLENGPLTVSWAMPMFQMDKVFFISQLGTDEAQKAGLKNVEHLEIGVDTVSYHPATKEEKIRIRNGLGIPQDAFVVLTVADNQERKNLWAGLKAISLLKSDIHIPIRYLLVTRENNIYGFKLRDLIGSLNIKEEVIIFERGIPTKDLWGLYAASDVYLQPSKAEGLGLPVLDAMACKIPVIATDTGAMHELLQDNRGYLIPPEYTFTDVWGNSKRDMISISHTKDVLKLLTERDTDRPENALEYVQARNWTIPANQLDKALKELLNEPQTETNKN